MAKVLYISYTGMLEPLGQSQVIQYLLGLSRNHKIRLISFEKPGHLANTALKEQLEQQLADAGIQWHLLSYHKRFSIFATAYDLACMLFKSLQLYRRDPYDIVHCRSYVPAIAGSMLKSWRGVRLVFDMRGFWADERVDGCIWKPNSRLYRIAKRIERWLLLTADHTVSLTEAGIREIEKFPYMQGVSFKATVIPTCTNLNAFQDRLQVPPDTGITTIGMLGSVGTWYLFEQMAECVAEIFRIDPKARLLVVNKSDHQFILDTLRNKAVDAGRVDIVSAEFSQMANYISQMSFGLFFIKPVFSKKASAPTKLGELLACGIPCLTNAGIGDVDKILKETQTGVCLAELKPDSYVQGYRDIQLLIQESDSRFRCRETAEQYFSLDRGVESYDQIYRELAG